MSNPAPDERAVVRFEVGKTYCTRSLGDYDIKVLARTAKRMTLEQDVHLAGYRYPLVRGIYVHDGVECCAPHGAHAFCPVIRANGEGYGISREERSK